MKHLQIEGVAFYDKETLVMFTPDVPQPGLITQRHSYGTMHLMSDGTFEHIAQKRRRSQSVLLKKLAHGRLSATKDGAVQLTLKVRKDEGIDPYEAILREASEAVRSAQ